MQPLWSSLRTFVAGSRTSETITPYSHVVYSYYLWAIIRSWSRLEATADRLVDVLHVSHLFQVLDGVKFAIQALDELSPPLSLCRRIHLAIHYGITAWVDITVRALLCKTADSYNADDLTHLGLDTFAIVVAARERIRTIRTDFANFPIEPSTQSEIDQAPFCGNHVKCRRQWVERWFTHLARQIHSTSTPIALTDAPIILQTMSHPGMNPACKDYNIGLVQLSAELPKEEKIIDDTVHRIKQSVRA